MIPSGVLTILRSHKAWQAAQRLSKGKLWKDNGLVVTSETGTPLDPEWFSKEFKRLARRAGVPDAHYHQLRHTFASLLLRGGMHPKVASEALGHSTTQITMDLYSHVSPGLQVAAAKVIDDAWGNFVTGSSANEVATKVATNRPSGH